MWLLCPFIDSSDHCRGLERFQTFVPSHNLLGFANQGNTAFRKARLGRGDIDSSDLPRPGAGCSNVVPWRQLLGVPRYQGNTAVRKARFGRR